MLPGSTGVGLNGFPELTGEECDLIECFVPDW